MSSSSAAHTLLNVLDDSNTSTAAGEASNDNATPNVESELSLLLPL